ncbi:DMT family transporter [Phaeobacter sp. 11ANDIMAR09]|uniref:DMT family transporter n=1 Tax=Phaeobacter sp. 11ANDIMAR09 TaxID=1225647 RepID=UPI0006C8BF4A|nr:DMT family transporter [Phaeobacter sp. 11ANDIMAR09]KPD12302.1 hypothetical protein AN476_11625 [Phaeobacter sp. 11ANDIMAR09]
MSALGLGLIAALCWGLHDFSVRFLKDQVPLMGSLMVVLTVGLLYEAGGMAAAGEGLLSSLGAASYAMAAGLCYLIAGLALYAAFRRGPVALVAPLIASYPILSVLFALWQGAEIPLWQWLAVVLIVAGVGFAAGGETEPATESDETGGGAVAVTLSLIAAAGFASTFALGQTAAQADPGAANLLTRFTALTLLLVLMMITRQSFWPGLKPLPILIVMGLLDGVALQSVLAAGSMPQAEFASVVSSIFGMLTVVLAWAFLRETMRLQQWLGCVAAFAGIAVLAY